VFWFDEGLHVYRKLDFRVSGGVGQQPRDCFIISCVCCFVQLLWYFLGFGFRRAADYYHGVSGCCLQHHSSVVEFPVNGVSVGSAYSTVQQR
jgi:hypothetical protein